MEVDRSEIIFEIEEFSMQGVILKCILRFLRIDFVVVYMQQSNNSSHIT